MLSPPPACPCQTWSSTVAGAGGARAVPAAEPAAGRDVPALTVLFARAEGEPEGFGIWEQL